MVRLYRIELPKRFTMWTVWARNRASAVDMVAHAQAVAAHDLVAIDITDDQIAGENPYRRLALAVIRQGACGSAHLRLTSDPETTGWLFEDGRIVPDHDAAGHSPTAIALCA